MLDTALLLLTITISISMLLNSSFTLEKINSNPRCTLTKKVPWLYNYEPDPTGYFYRRQKENTTNRTPWLFKSSPTILTTCASQLFNFEKILVTALLISCLFGLRYRIVFEKIPHHSPRVDLIKKQDVIYFFPS